MEPPNKNKRTCCAFGVKRIYIGYLLHSVVSILVSEDGKSKKKNKKDSQLIVRLPRTDRDAFTSLCDDLDTSAAREIRSFIKKFLRDNAQKAD